MPITVELWTELTNPIVEGQVLAISLPRELATDLRFPLLKWVDPWGDTVFNRAQCAELVAELELASEVFGDDGLAPVLALAGRAASEPHSYLVFIGD